MAFVRIGVYSLLILTATVSAQRGVESLYFVQASVQTRTDRNRIVALGIAIDGVLSDSVTLFATEKEVTALSKLGLKLQVEPVSALRRDFPAEDDAFHDYAETVTAMEKIVGTHPDLARVVSIGKSLEGRAVLALRLSSKPEIDSLPTAMFMGCHHAREHLSVEVPLMLAQYLADHYPQEARIRRLLDTREVWIVPMVNPDGAEYDISGRNRPLRYKYWRKNRRDNHDGTFGVDLNRNYGGPNWGGQGSSGSTESDIYHGSSSFSEPETLAIRDFVRARKNATVLLTFHTFSELILWPWGYSDHAIANTTDRRVFEAMGKAMAEWNHYTPQKSSELYITSGDTTDWAYDELNIFAFTFELSPASLFDGGFYPGAQLIQPTFNANIEPAIYMIDLADNPYRVLENQIH